MDKPLPAAPPELADIADVIGGEGALRLLELRAGTRVHVPHPANAATSWLCEALGAETTDRLARQFGGETLRLPMCKEWRARVYLGRGGMSQAEIALKLGASEKFVQRLANTNWKPQSSRRRALPRGTNSQQLGLPLA